MTDRTIVVLHRSPATAYGGRVGMLKFIRRLLRRRRDASRWRITPERALAIIAAAAEEADPIGSTATRGLASTRRPKSAPPSVVAASRAYFSNDAAATPEAALAQLLAYIEAFPHDERLQVLAARMLDRSPMRDKATAAWSGIAERFPDVAADKAGRRGGFLRRRTVGLEKRRLTAERSAQILARAAVEADPVAAAVVRGRSAGTSAKPPPSTIKAAARLVSRSLPDDADTALAELLSFVETHPADEHLQVLAGRILERSSLRETASAAWAGIGERFPRSSVAFRRRVGHFSRENGVEAAHAWLLTRFPAVPTEPADLVAYAVGFSQLNEFDFADPAHEALLGLHPAESWVYTLYADSLERRGEHDLARQILEQGQAALPAENPEIEKRLARIDDRFTRIRMRFPELTIRDAVSNQGLLKLFLTQAALGRPATSPHRPSLGRTLLVTGSLGAGGAERQFVTTALRLQAACRERAIQGAEAQAAVRHVVHGPICVMCRSLTSRSGGDFFLPTLKAVDLPVTEIVALPASRGDEPGSAMEPFARFLEFLPQQISENAVRVSDELRSIRPEVVHIWQDGMILRAAAAALVAGVPRIVLSVRTMPPIDRLGRKKPEYETLYRCLIDTPGIVVTANSRRAARRYAEWLDVEPSRIGVIHNGVAPLPTSCDDTTAALFELFEAATPGATFTVGSVMRFDENKRPGAWLESAALVLRAVPTARFILVGDGPLLKQAREHAGQLGIAERVLFVGRSPHVGYWLTRMDVLLLLSRIEGLPNVLIEAQFAGVPVVTTPAGGAVETIAAGETGEVLASELRVDPEEVAAILVALAGDPERRRRMSRAAEAFAEANFSVDTMIARTIEAYLGGP